MKRFTQSLVLAIAVATAAGCSTANPDVISRNSAQRVQLVREAIVESTRYVVVDGTQTGIGAATGAVVGGVAGASLGGRHESLAFGVLGAVAAGVLGNAIERAATTEQAVELTLRFSDGTRQAVVQGRGEQQFYPGDHVSVVGGGNQVRVTRAR